VQKRAANFANKINESGWETLAQRRLIVPLPPGDNPIAVNKYYYYYYYYYYKHHFQGIHRGDELGK